eukprot:gene7237-346_t
MQETAIAAGLTMLKKKGVVPRGVDDESELDYAESIRTRTVPHAEHGTADQTPAASKVFRGDNDCLVDQLIAACHEHKEASSAPLPGFGRELQPYFAEGDFIPPPSALRMISGSNNSTRASSPKQQAAPAPANKRAAPTGRPVTKANNNQLPCPKKPLDSSCRAKKNLAQSKYPQLVAPVSVPACPGIFSSPNPRELPVPSMNLFKRATSPPAHCPGFPVMGNSAVLVCV